MIHDQAIIDPKAELADDVEVGPWTIIGPEVKIDAGTVIGPHVVLKGPTKIGKNNKIFQFSSIGEDCQDKKYNGERTFLEIGDNNQIREGCTIHRGTAQDNSVTKVGSDNLLMAYVHIGHDCIVGNDVILANNVALAGHVNVSSNVILGGFTLVHQFTSIGFRAMAGMGSAISKDVPAFVMVTGNPAEAHGMNFEGLRRSGYAKEAINALRKAYKIVYRQSLTIENALIELADLVKENPSENVDVQIFIDSITSSTRGIVR